MFQSTRPARGATAQLRHDAVGVSVSIHAPREGRDEIVRPERVGLQVSIHAPREGRDPFRLWSTPCS